MPSDAQSLPLLADPALVGTGNEWRSASELGLTAAEREAAFGAAADFGPPLLVVSPVEAGGTGVRVHWGNSAARGLLGRSLAQGPDPAGSRMPVARLGQPKNWSVVTGNLIAGNDVGGEWHSAALDTPESAGGLVRLRVRPVVAPADGASDKYLVWLRPADDELVQAEEAVSEAEFRFRTLGDNAPIGILVSDVGLRLSFVNEGFAAIVGVDRRSLLGTNWLDVFDAEDLPAVLESLEGVLSGRRADLPLRVHCSTGPQRWVQLRLAPVTTRRRAAGFVGTVEDITARRSWESQLAHQARHDALTGLANRRQLLESLADYYAGRRRGDHLMAVLFFDLDGFKSVNDTFGHDAGDRILVEVARRLSGAARDEDLVARIAGDEFVVMLRNAAGRTEAEAAASRLLAAVCQDVQIGDTSVRVSASVGVALAADHDTAAELLRCADEGMYQAKRSGRRVSSAEPQAKSA
jgi:diguanylate cyclase (GGDEF)-like protein/PAS domain S-box-containing protein